MGLLQVTGPSSDSSGVKIRYRLVRAVGALPEDAAPTVAGLPPVVVSTQPVSGARDVQPRVTEIRATFSKEMADRSWGWRTAWQDSMPEIISEPRYESDHRTCVIKVRLEPGERMLVGLTLKSSRILRTRPVVRRFPIC